MARLPWQHVRSRKKSGSEKQQSTEGQGWFARSTAEPSRQALADLVKAHRRENSGDSNSLRSRSRGTTITSTDWENGRSRSTSVAHENRLALDSPTRTREGSICSNVDSSSSRNIVGKGSAMLRRTGSKLSLSSTGSSSTMGITSPPRTTTGTSIAATRDEIRNKISAPFDFQHVTHTEQTHFQGLSRIEEAELAHRFSTVATDQTAISELRGIQASTIDTTDPRSVVVVHKDQAAPIEEAANSPTTSASQPTPPPKDIAKLPRIDGMITLLDTPMHSNETSFSTKFSDLPTLPNIDTSFKEDDVLSSPPSARSFVSTNHLEDKPLPHLPIIHAVTTEDDTARAMISAPLPTPPVSVTHGQDSSFFAPITHHRQKSSVALPRHMTLYPNAKASMPNLQASSFLEATGKSLPRHRSDIGLSRQMEEAVAVRSSPTSTNFSAIDTYGWEDVVDEAWDDIDNTPDSGYASLIGQNNSQHERLGVKSFGVDNSASSTPLMMAEAPRLQLGSLGNSFDNSFSSCLGSTTQYGQRQEDAPSDSLAGLGIKSCSAATSPPTAVNFSRSSSLRLPKHGLIHHGPHESLTRSSSQESIILSIASSINGTQRSSNSSMLADEMISISCIQEDIIREAPEEDQDENIDSAAERPRVRPESGCLPTNMMGKIASRPIVVEQKADPPPTPAVAKHEYSKSTSKVAVPERRSSIVAADAARSPRTRSNTTGARIRHGSRTSYSLFPAAASPSSSTA